jgi:hypothetical protein
MVQNQVQLILYLLQAVMYMSQDMKEVLQHHHGNNNEKISLQLQEVRVKNQIKPDFDKMSGFFVFITYLSN